MSGNGAATTPDFTSSKGTPASPAANGTYKMPVEALPKAAHIMGSSWSVAGGKFYKLVQESQPKLPAGIYSHWNNSAGECITQAITSKHDDLFDLPGLPTKYILDQIDVFWRKTAEYARYGFIQKRGILLYGPPGCGKTSVTNLLKQQIIKRDGVVFVPSNGFAILTNGLDELRKVEPTRPIMTLTEDLESFLESSNNSNNGGQERAALALYDGERQINNVVHVATTNKPDLLSDRFIRRPGRFDLVIGVFAPTAETRRAYLQAICHEQISNKVLEDIVERSEGLSLAYLREIASTYLVLEIPLEETIARLRELETKKYPTKGRMGYTIGFSPERD